MYRIFCVILLFAATHCLVSSCQADPTVGVYYYPWWGANQGAHTFDETLRAHTSPDDHLPAVGDEYNSRDPSVISSHIDQSHLGNISMWSMSWWGPNRFEDITIRNHILTHPRADELTYTIHYETGGRLGSHQNPDYTNLIPDFHFLANNIFNNPNYMRIDGRPVIVMYLSRVFFDDAAGATALSNLRTTMQQAYGYDPYIIGDHLFNNVASGAGNLDAITTFDVYGQVFKPGGGVVNQTRIDNLEQIYDNAKTIADGLGVDFVPGLTPGYNDKAVRAGNDPAARYLENLPGQQFGTAMEAMLQDAVLPHTDSDINDLILINSFNEWHEDTQIEATVAGQTTNQDDSLSGTDLTVGRYYEGYGNRYLDILRNATQTTPPLTAAEIRWGRGTANGLFVGNFTDLANWNADDVSPDAPRLPTSIDRARVDRGGSQMTFDSTIHVNDFLFGVSEAGQTFVFEPSADVTLDTNFFVSFNQGDVSVDIESGASVSVGGNFLLGQYDGTSNGNNTMDDNDITVTVAGLLEVDGVTILGDRYGLDGSGIPNPTTTSELVDVLLDVTTGTLVTSNLVFAPNGDLATYLATNTIPGNENTLSVRVGDLGQIIFPGADRTAEVLDLISEGLLYTDSASGSLQILYDGSDTLVEVTINGDFNGDGRVDAVDFLEWQKNPSIGSLADWQNNYGVVSEAATSAVPEPDTLVLLMCGVIGLQNRRQRRIC